MTRSDSLWPAVIPSAPRPTFENVSQPGARTGILFHDRVPSRGASAAFRGGNITKTGNRPVGQHRPTKENRAETPFLRPAHTDRHVHLHPSMNAVPASTNPA